MNLRELRVGAGLLAGAAIASSMASCSFEEVHCEATFETDAAPGFINSWSTQECGAEMLGNNFTRIEIQDDGQSIHLEISGPLSADANEVEIEYWDGATLWRHDGHFNGVGPMCSVLFESARKEEWTKTTRVRAKGTIECPGKLTSLDDEELGFFNASFDVFASDDALILDL